MSSLVIVESPTKAKTIGKFLGKEYVIKASMGHVMDLPKSKLGVDIEHDFAPDYEVMPDKKQIIAELKAAAKGATEIILATDPDREGEAIAYYVAEILGGNTKKKIESYKRMVFHEITNEAIEEALKNPRKIDFHLVDAQTARRVLDRLVGYKLSPLLWQKVRRGLSAGRVQSIALRLIVEREREIEKFKKEAYWTIGALLEKEKGDKAAVEFELVEIQEKRIETSETFDLYDGQYKITKTSLTTEKQAQDIVTDLQKQTFTIADVAQKETKRSPQPPYITSTLQQDASRRLGLSGKRTMSLAQKLYEEGYITYHRTDSVAMAASAQGSIIGFIKKEYGDKYVQPRSYTTKQKLAQEAHEAIRPTKVATTQSHVAQDLGVQYSKLYELIWKRAVASQMADAIIESTAVIVHTNEKKYTFKANGSVLKFDGFLKVNPFALQDTRLPQYQVGEQLKAQSIHSDAHETSPPPRYNDASIIKTLEEKGIGRPSTYATIISTIEARRYIERAEGRFTATPVGAAVNDFLVKNFSEIDDIPFTAQMEDDLDAIANEGRDWVKMMREFYQPFEKKLEVVKKADRVKIEVETVDETCPECGANLVIRIGKFGKFISCSRFPDCKFTKPYIEETGFKCPKCGFRPEGSSPAGGDVIVKKTRKGRKFYGCSNYPNCDFAAWNLNDLKSQDPTKPYSDANKEPGEHIRKPNLHVKKIVSRKK